MERVFLLLFVWGSVSANISAQAITAFKGIPTTKVSEGGIERLPENLTPEQAVNLRCVISQIGEDYYWGVN